MKKLKKYILLFLIIITTYFLLVKIFPDNLVTTSMETNEELKKEIEDLYKVRSDVFMNGNLKDLQNIYDSATKYGRWTLEHEVQRAKYLKDWSNDRNITFKNISSTVKVKKFYNVGDKLRVLLDEYFKIDYIYSDDENSMVNTFAIRIRHTLNLVNKNDKRMIYTDWYLDCFDDATGDYSRNIPNDTAGLNNEFVDTVNMAQSNISELRPYYDRQKAAEYADKYCGAWWDSGNNYSYNKKYFDYNGAGGDCTNFVSQVLGDKEAGGLRQDGAWHCELPKYGRGSGSTAWVNADSFKNYLIYSGKGYVIKKGTFEALTTPGSNGVAAVSKLKQGDVICYIKKGNVDHFAVVVAFDSNGYPLVDTHTTDRYHVPWDLGWSDKKIIFCMIHING